MCSITESTSIFKKLHGGQHLPLCFVSFHFLPFVDFSSDVAVSSFLATNSSCSISHPLNSSEYGDNDHILGTREVQ